MFGNLRDPDFISMTSAFIKTQKCRVDDFDSLRAWWDSLKSEIKRSCVDYCARKRTLINRERTALNKRIICLKNRFHFGDTTALKELKESQCALSSLIQKVAEGAKIRARAKWIEEEKTSFTSLFDVNGLRNLHNLTSKTFLLISMSLCFPKAPP